MLLAPEQGQRKGTKESFNWLMSSGKPAWPRSCSPRGSGRRGVRQVLRIACWTRRTKKPEPLRVSILGRGLSPSEKEDPQHYPNDHQNHQKGQQEECEHSQHGGETSTKGPAALDLQ